MQDSALPGVTSCRKADATGTAEMLPPTHGLTALVFGGYGSLAASSMSPWDGLHSKGSLMWPEVLGRLSAAV